VLSEGDRYQQLQLAAQDISPRSIPNALDDGLDGWSFLMRTPDRKFALAYFENKALRAQLKGFTSNARYRWHWFDTRTGEWSTPIELQSGSDGSLRSPAFGQGGEQSSGDVAAKILQVP
jgi:hypothetical protein